MSIFQERSGHRVMHHSVQYRVLQIQGVVLNNLKKNRLNTFFICLATAFTDLIVIGCYFQIY